MSIQMSDGYGTCSDHWGKGELTALQENVWMRECWAAKVAWRNRTQRSMQHMPAPTDAFPQ
jgi:hypothetical protein